MLSWVILKEMHLPYSHFPQGTLFKRQNVSLQCFQGPFRWEVSFHSISIFATTEGM